MGKIEPEQLGQWYQAHGAQLLLYARQWLDYEQAREVVQEAFLKLLGQKTVENPQAWLFRTVRNEAINRYRRQKRHKQWEGVARNQPGWFEPQMDERLDARVAQELLEGMPPEQREIVVMRIWGSLTLREIAEIVGMPVSTVHRRYEEALAQIKKGMTKCQMKNT